MYLFKAILYYAFKHKFYIHVYIFSLNGKYKLIKILKAYNLPYHLSMNS